MKGCKLPAGDLMARTTSLTKKNTHKIRGLSGILGLGCLGVGGMIVLAFLFLSLSSVSVNAIISNQPEVVGIVDVWE